ncbi:hypothetical protein B0H14DRAFT_3609922 [Mycena olivaceomarginata]|nr:hypothetical protein B0H14DRAFT_3609922 [Mycena olivaceomarginata]
MASGFTSVAQMPSSTSNSTCLLCFPERWRYWTDPNDINVATRPPTRCAPLVPTLPLPLPFKSRVELTGCRAPADTDTRRRRRDAHRASSPERRKARTARVASRELRPPPMPTHPRPSRRAAWDRAIDVHPPSHSDSRWRAGCTVETRQSRTRKRIPSLPLSAIQILRARLPRSGHRPGNFFKSLPELDVILMEIPEPNKIQFLFPASRVISSTRPSAYSKLTYTDAFHGPADSHNSIAPAFVLGHTHNGTDALSDLLGELDANPVEFEGLCALGGCYDRRIPVEIKCEDREGERERGERHWTSISVWWAHHVLILELGANPVEFEGLCVSSADATSVVFLISLQTLHATPQWAPPVLAPPPTMQLIQDEKLGNSVEILTRATSAGSRGTAGYLASVVWSYEIERRLLVPPCPAPSPADDAVCAASSRRFLSLQDTNSKDAMAILNQKYSHVPGFARRKTFAAAFSRAFDAYLLSTIKSQVESAIATLPLQEENPDADRLERRRKVVLMLVDIITTHQLPKRYDRPNESKTIVCDSSKRIQPSTAPKFSAEVREAATHEQDMPTLRFGTKWKISLLNNR